MLCADPGERQVRETESGVLRLWALEGETAWIQILPLSLGTCKVQLGIGAQSELNDLIHTKQAAEIPGQSKCSVNV